ncbi:PblB [Streptococcus pneumoniae]|nr:PblB [Streptococcus pneumoniae]
MLYLLNKDVRTVRWNGEPLHEATSAIVKETMNGDFTLTVKYPISDSGIYQLIQEDMLIKAPTPVLGAQLFRIKKPVEYNDHLEITAYHISDDVMQRSITPVSVTSQSCGMTLSRMVQNTKTALGDFSFNSDIQDRRTFNTTETETLYSILLDGKHSIVGTWEGELVRDNFAMTVKKSRGENRGVVITTHKNLKNYQRTKNSQNVVTRIHAKSTFKPEGAEKETTIRVTVDSPLINSYPYINEKEYENNNAKTVEELQKWAQSKFSNEGIDKVSDAIKIEAYELDGQVVHMGDTVNLKSWKHNVDAFKKAIAYEFDALKEEYISLTFDDKAGIGGSRASGGLSSAADAILGVTESAQEIALEKALQNADLDFDHKAGLLRQEISDDIELAKARAEEVKRELSDTINQRFNSFDNGPLKETKRKAEEALRNAGASSSLAQESKRIGLDSVARLEAFKSQTTSAQTALSGDLDALKRTIANDIRPKQAQAEAEIAKQVEALSRTKNELAGASTLLAQEAKRIELDSVARLEAFKSQTTSAQTALSGDLDALKRTIANDIRPKQAQAEAEIAKQVEALSRTKNELAGASTLLAQEAKRIELDSVARLEAFKSQTTSAQTALSGDLDALKRTIVNDIRPKQAQAEAEIAKQVEALSRTKNELAGVKSAQATYKETTTRRLSELTNLANGKASKSELTQTAEELSSKIASVQASGRNLFLNSLFKQDIPKTGIWTTSTYTATIDSESKYLGHKALKIIGLNPSGRDGGNPKVTYPALGQFGKVIPGSTTNQDVTISFYAKANKNGIMLRSRLGNIGYKTGNVTLSTEIKRYAVHIPKGWTNESKRTTNEWLFNFNQEGTVWIWMPKFEISDVDTSYSEAPEDIEGQISTVESTFKQRANSLEAGVSRLTEGLRTKADISALNVTAENIRQSVKRLETDTQNKLNQKLSQAEFEVRAGSIRQEILNATKDKADKTLVVSEAGKLREEFSKMKVGGRNLWIKSKTVGAVIEKLPENHVTGQKECYRLENNSTLTFNLEPDFSSRLYQKVTFSAWIKYENVVQGRNSWNVFNCFKHYLFRKNSETGVQSGPDYDTLGRYKGSADWKYITFTYDYSEKTNFDQLKTSLRFNLEGATSGTAWVTGIKVEIGSVATDWSPAPEDGENELLVAKTEFKRTADGLSTKMAAVESYVGQDGQRQEALQRYTREESARQATAVRELVNRDFVGKATYQEDVKGINQRIEAVKTSANTEGLRTKADISALNVTAENIRQSVKSLETDTQNKLNQKLSQAEFEVRAGSIRQEILNATKDKASKSELTQTAEELSSKIASVQASGRNLFLNSLFKQDISKTGIWTTSTYTAAIDSESKYLGYNALKIIGLNPSGRDGGNPKVTYPALGQFGKVIPGSTTNQDVTISFYAKANKNGIMLRSRLGNIGYKTGNVTLSTEIKRYVVHIPKGWTNESKQTTNEWLFNFNQEGTVWIWMPKFEISDVDTSYSEAPEDIESQISTVESTFKQRANSLEAGVNRLTEGLRTKVDISALNVTAENIRQSVKSLETDTQNKLNQKLSQAEFEVRAGSIRQEILNATKDKASKSELTQTAEELSSKIASVQVGGINLLRNTASLLIGDRSKGCWMSASGGNGRAISVEVLDPPKKMIKNMIRVIENTNGGNKDLTQLVRLRIGEKYTISCYARIASDSPNANVNLLFRSWANNTDLNRKFQKSISHKNWQKYSFTFTADAIENSIQFGQSGAGIIEICAPKIESGTLATDYSEAPEDIEGQISTVESTFKQRANSLDAGVRSLTEGLRTKVDISALNVTAENIRQSVKSLETDTQNKLNQKLSQAEFEVRAGSIRQEILNATKDKADKTLVVSEAGKLREEFSKMKVGGRNLWIKSKTVGAVIEKLPENHVTGQKECYRLENNSTLTFNLEPDFSSRLYQKVTFSAWIKYENVVQGRNFWNVFNCFKHYLFRKNSETGVQSGPDYATLGMYKGSADWKYITFTYDYSEKTNFDQLKTSLRFNLEGATSGTAWVTGIKVEIGSVATDWSPAPEDADGLITEAKATFERTAQGLRTDLSAIQEYVNKDGQRQEALRTYSREESARQATAVRELVNRDFVGKATYQEDVKGINQRIEAVKTSANKDIASQIASYRQSVDGKFTDISSQITTYKQDVGGQISGLSNRLTSSEQGTTTQISNLSNRINSNKQGADNQISNLKTQVATNKDNAERQMGRISDQVSANKANADSQFANVTNQLARKVETTDFQRVKETSKLYERILGNTENGIADKVARMALTNQLFQVEVAKNASNGQNLLKGTKDFSGGWKNKGANWKKHAEKYKGVDVLFKNNSWNGVGQEIDAKIGEVYTFSLWMKSDWKNDTVNFYVNRNGSVEKGWGVPSETSVAITSEWKRYSFTFKITVDGFIFPRVERLNQNTNLYIAGLKLEKGSYATPYTEAPEDTDEAIRSVQSQLTGSWAVQNINSAGDIISGINLGANGHNRFVGKLTHITGETLIDRAVIKSAMVDKLKTANFEAGSVTTTILDAEAVTAEKLKVDNALIRKLTANDAFIDQLISKRIFSTKVESVISSSTFLEAYQGRIGGFTLGQFDQGGGRWISGVNQFSVGMGNGAGYGVRTAFWANWGNNWNYAGPKAWNVNTDGKMYCRNEVGFYDQVDFSNSSRANFYGNTTFSRSPVFSNGIELGSKDVLGDGWNPKGGRNAVVWWNQVGSGSVKYWMEQKSDRRLKENITDTAVKALDKINRLRMVAFDFIESKKHEEIGLIAQEAETIVPRIVSRDPENPDGYLHIDYTALVPYLIKAIQELNQKIEKMEKTIA